MIKMLKSLTLGEEKFLAAASILSTNIASAFFTIFVIQKAKEKWASAAMAVANCTTVGIFFVIIFMLQLPEIPPAEAILREKYDFKSPVPIGSFFVIVGLILVGVFEVFTKIYAGDHMPIHGHSHTHEMKEIASVSVVENGICSEETFAPEMPSLYKYIMFALFMSLHSLTEGIPLGYKKTTDELHAYFLPLLAHKILEAASVAFAGIREQNKYALLGSFVHASMTPLGTAIGYLLGAMDSSFSADLTIIFLMSISTAVMIYITFVEVLAPEMRNTAIPDWAKVFCIFIGFIITGTIATFIHALEG